MPARIMGDFSTQHIGLPLEYFETRDCFLDCRSDGMITIDPSAMIGWNVTIIVESHDPLEYGRVVARPTTIDAGVFVAAFAILYNCYVGKNSIVALGTVVRSRDVPPNVIVEGNPARIIAVRDIGLNWSYLTTPVELPQSKLLQRKFGAST